MEKRSTVGSIELFVGSLRAETIESSSTRPLRSNYALFSARLSRKNGGKVLRSLLLLRQFEKGELNNWHGTGDLKRFPHSRP